MGTYEEEARRIRQHCRRWPLKVLIWGPGVPAPTASTKQRQGYRKRLKIKEELKQAFSSAEVYFSEDPEMEAISAVYTDPLLKEALQAKIADLIIILDTGSGRGVFLEEDHFLLQYTWFCRKAYVFLPEKYVTSKGLVSAIFKYLPSDHIIGYTNDEFKSSALATVKVVKIAEEVALRLYLAGDPP